MNKPSSYSKTIARAAVAAFGGRPHVDRYWDDDHKNYVDLVSCNDSPCAGVTSFATVGVSDIPLVLDGKDIEVRAALVGAVGSDFEFFGNCLSTAAFCVINSRWPVAPGVMFPNIVAMYEEHLAMKHLLFLPPFVWDDRLRTVSVETRRVAWLLAIPISQEEMEYAQSEGVSKLEEIFDEQQIDIFNLNRVPVVCA